MLLSAALFMNQWFLAALTHREIIGRRLEQLQNLQLLSAAVGLILIMHRIAAAALIRLRSTRLCRFLLVCPDYRLAVAAVPLVVATSIYWKTACQRDGIPLLLPITILSFMRSTVCSVLLFLLLSVLLAKIPRFRFAPVVVAIPWAILIPLETSIYIFGRTRLEAQHFGLATWEGLGGFLIPSIIVLVAACAGLCLGAGLLATKYAGRISWEGCVRMAMLLFAVWIVNGASIGYWLSKTFTLRSLDQAALESYYSQLQYIQADPVSHVLCEAIPKSSRFRAIDDWQTVREPIAYYHLPLEDRPSKPLQQRPFRRVILIFSESLSAFFLQSSNPQLPGTLMPYLDSLASEGRIFRNHRTSALPTGPGTAVTYCSHPNPSLVNATNFRQSFVQNLRSHGWHTVFNTSVTRLFDNQGRKAASAGFESLLDPLNLENSDDNAYVTGWGLCDRVTFRRATEYLAARREQPTFMTILTCDTHTPTGRKEYGDLKYPPPPDWIREYPTLAPLLASFFRYDHDLELFLSELKAAELYDDDTLVIITADHCCPSGPMLLELPGSSKSPFERIPLVLLTPRSLPPLDVNRATSQLDVGPSILHLLGLPIPAGCWGRSIFTTDQPPAPFVGITCKRVRIDHEGGTEVFDIDQPTTAMQRGLRDLLHSYVR